MNSNYLCGMEVYNKMKKIESVTDIAEAQSKVRDRKFMFIWDIYA